MSLNKENQEWLQVCGGEHYTYDISPFVVKEKLLEMQNRIDELESQIEFKIKECMELAQGLNRYKNDYFDNKKKIDELENPWISVDDKTPEHDEGEWSKPVIAMCDCGLIYRLSYSGCWQRTKAFVENASKEVTHWMHIPKLNKDYK